MYTSFPFVDKLGLLNLFIDLLTCSTGFCPDGWLESEHSGTCIENVRYQDETWFRAMLNCGYNFAQLPNIINAKMNKFLFGRKYFIIFQCFISSCLDFISSEKTL